MLLAVLLGAALLSMVAARISVPYPTLLAIGGMVLALLPAMASIAVPPKLILALFVAPVLLDAAHDASWRDLVRNWRPVLSLVIVAVGLTTVAVAWVTRLFLCLNCLGLPPLPWALSLHPQTR